jgi:hypothetical protein
MAAKKEDIKETALIVAGVYVISILVVTLPIIFKGDFDDYNYGDDLSFMFQCIWLLFLILLVPVLLVHLVNRDARNDRNNQ